MPEKRRAAFADSLPPNFYEWDAVMEKETTVEEWKGLSAKTLVVSDAATRLPVRQIVDILAHACPHWTFHAIPEGGHMAPLTRPELEKLLSEKVKSGLYQSPSEMIREGLRLLEERDRLHQVRLADLRKEILRRASHETHPFSAKLTAATISSTVIAPS